MTQAPTLTRVTRFGFVNAYLVAEEDGLTLIDTTIGKGGAKAILAAAGRLEMPIVRIAPTPSTGDHGGGLDHLAAPRPASSVLIAGRDARLLGKDMTSD